MKIKVYIAFLFAAVLMTACSNIDEDERLIYVKPAPVERCVLIEDFTGQRCPNCPDAAEEIEKLIGQYGDAIIAVSIHSGPLGFHTNSRFYGLATSIGDDYYNHWNLEFQPVGMIDRSAPAEYTAWGTLVREELQKTAPVEIELEAAVSDSLELSIHTSVKGVDGNTLGKLQLWVVEDSITAFQMLSDGTRNDNYTHRHVFRIAVNGQWGDDITVNEGYIVEQDNYIIINNDWNPNKLSVVAFVYNDNGVLQVTKAKVQRPLLE
ncbi:MAG: Omp28 family outer membrane lipoprotein [Muribaculaceae bacterium]|nr:Omp28 family outer membrane lipoprotein [Muribaculaceae bacterium]